MSKRSKHAFVIAAAAGMACSLAASTVFAAAPNQSTGAKPVSYYVGDTTKYKQPVTISVGWESVQGPVPGSTQTKNLYVSYLQKRLNVKFDWKFLTPASQLATKENLAIADNEMPDVMRVNKQQLVQLVQSGEVEDLTSAFNRYASPYIKDIYASNQNRALKEATFNGKLMAIPDTQIGLQFNELWVRQDWLDKLHLKPPKTLADIEHITKAFIDHHMGGKHTVGLIGLGAPSNGLQGNPIVSYNNQGGWDTIFSLYGAYPGSWMNVNGKVQYGSIQPGAKQALATLHQMYAEGLIDPQFATNSTDQEYAELAGGQCGIYFGAWWAPLYPLYSSVEQNPTAHWVSYIAPVNPQGKLNVLAPPWAQQYVVVKKGFAHPDAVVKVINLGQAGIRFVDPGSENFYDRKDTGGGAWPLLVQLDWYNAIVKGYQEITKAVQTHNTDGIEPRFVTYYHNYLQNAANPNPAKDIASWENANAYVNAARPLAQNLSSIHETEPLNVVVPQNMSAQWAEMLKQESETYLQIVTGQKPLSAFDSFVQEWNALGGQNLTQYIQQNVKNFQ